jgi:plastocyanin domain-containing protein
MIACRNASIVGAAMVASLLVAFGACDKKDASAESHSAPACATCVTANEHGFSPPSITIPKGAPGSKATITFTRTTDQTCAKDAVFPDLGIKAPLPLNQPVTVEVPSDTPRTLTFQCGMAMYKGSVVVR